MAVLKVWDGSDWFEIPVTTDHGDLTGLSDDDHTIYLKIDGTGAMTGTLDMGTVAKLFDVAAQSSEPGSPTTGLVYLDDGTNAQAASETFRYYDGTNWVDVGLRIVNGTGIAFATDVNNNTVISVDESAVDHGGLGGLSDADHVKYATSFLNAAIRDSVLLKANSFNFSASATHTVTMGGTAYTSAATYLAFAQMNTGTTHVLKTQQTSATQFTVTAAASNSAACKWFAIGY